MKLGIFIFILAIVIPGKLLAQGSLEPLSIAQQKTIDSDSDGLSDYYEIYVYHTSISNPDTDHDGFLDGGEVQFAFDPNKNGNDKLQKEIVVTLADQSLSYKLGDYIVGTFKISSGKKYFSTPLGEFSVLKKRPIVDYVGLGYSYPKTKWNLMFRPGRVGNFYIHGAYWHNNFGTPMSHGCVNVSYANMEALYNWAEVGTKVVIK